MKKFTTILTLILVATLSINAEEYYAINESTEYSCSTATLSQAWNGTLREIHTYDITKKNTGTINCELRVQLAAAYSPTIYIEYSEDNGTNWTTLKKITDLNSSWKQFTITGLPQYVTNLRFRYKGSLKGFVRNVTLMGVDIDYTYVNEKDNSVVYTSYGDNTDAPALNWLGWSEVRREVADNEVTVFVKNNYEGKKFLIKKDDLYLDMTNLTNQNDGNVTTAVTFTETGTPVELVYTSNGCCIKYKDIFLNHNMFGTNKGWTCTATNTEDYWVVNGTETDFTMSSTSYQDNTVKVEWNDAANAYQMFYDNTNDANTAHFQLEEVTANMKITDTQWGTFSAPFAVRIPNNVKAYVGKMEQGWIRMTEIKDVIPAYTGVVVTSDELVNEELSGIIEETEELESCYTPNCDGFVKTFTTTGDYLLQKQNDVVGWYKISGDGFKLANNRCYLAGTTVTTDNARSFIGLNATDGDATGISSIASEAGSKADGKYLVNGKVVIVKAGKAYNMNGQRL